ncbi:MAG: HNH endonuclease signature motif containing protein [Actinomycetota bacterium]
MNRCWRRPASSATSISGSSFASGSVSPTPTAPHRIPRCSTRGRRLHLRQDLDGAFHLTARLGNTQGLIAEEILERFHSVELEHDLTTARALEVGAPLPRTAGQRHADAFIAALMTTTVAPDAARPAEPLINVTTDQVTFEHHVVEQLSTDAPDALDPTRFMERVSRSRHGSWVHPATLPALALLGHVRRVVFDSAGVTIDLGRRQRLFTGSAREAVLVAQARCTSPGCHIAAHHCEIDHIIPWASGGRTDQRNARVRCGRHHRDHTPPGPDPPTDRAA